MFILRTFNHDSGEEFNIELGDSYIIHRKDSKRFNEMIDDLWIDPILKHVIEDCWAVVEAQNGAIKSPILFTDRAYIMTESGRTYHRISME